LPVHYRGAQPGARAFASGCPQSRAADPGEGRYSCRILRRTRDGRGGIITPPRRISTASILKRYDILFVVDEVIWLQ
jgi:hypothetical protein